MGLQKDWRKLNIVKKKMGEILVGRTLVAVLVGITESTHFAEQDEWNTCRKYGPWGRFFQNHKTVVRS